MTFALDITTAQGKTLRTLLHRFIPGVAVWAYGSRVKWTARPNSDLDLVAFTTPAQNVLVSDLKEALAESDLPFVVDIHVWNEVPERFHVIICNEYVVIQKAEKKEPDCERPVGWNEKTLGELTENFDGQRIPVKESERKPGPYPYYGASGIVDHVDNYIFDGDYLLIAEDGENLRTQKTPIAFLARGKFWVNNHAHIVTGNTGSDTRFLMYALNNADINGYLTGSTMPKLTQGNMNRIPILAPPPVEQRAIASVLGALDDKIELNRRMNETLEAMAQALFQNWFMDTTQAGLPKGWCYATIAELCEINSWTLGKGDEIERIEYVEISKVVRGDIGKIQCYGRGEEPSRARRRLRHGDTVLSTVRPDRGSYFLCLHPSPSLIASTGFAVLTPKKAPWSFIHAAVTQTDVFEYLGQQADGGAYPAVRPEIIGGLKVPWPGKPELVEAFHKACAPLYEKAEHNRQESRTLAALRDSLLPKLLSGELRIPFK